MNKKLKRSLAYFFGVTGLALIAVKVLHIFVESAAWLYVPAVAIGIVAGFIEYKKR